MTDNVRERVRNTMAQVLQEDLATITDDASPESLGSWDSIGQMNIIISLEEEFGIAFTDVQTDRLRSFDQAVQIVSEAVSGRR